MILHLISSPIFLEYVIDQFENVNKDNNEYYYIYTTVVEKKKIPGRSEIKVLQRDSREYYSLIESLSKFDVLILHSINPAYYKFVLNSPDKLNIVWLVFGTEIYTVFRKIRNRTYLPKTRKLYLFSRVFIVDLIKPVYRFFTRQNTNESYTKKCLKRIDFMGLTVRETTQFLVDSGLTRAEFVEFGYYSIEDTIGEKLFEKQVEGDHILIGNSASFSNNHLDALELLDKKIIGNRNIFVPLSYGEPHVMKKVSRAGYRRFGRQFKPLLEFLPKDEYNKIILKCGYVIMNHLRPQARGNIVTALWLGAKVFLNKETIYYKELQEKGLVIFPVSEIIDNPGRAFEKLSQSDIDNNRRILFELYNHDRVLSRTKKLVEIATTVKYN